MVSGTDAGRKGAGNWRTPPWSTDARPWQDLDQRLQASHLARQVRAFVLGLDVEALRRDYLGVGKQALPPELMLMVVLYEMQTGQLHPCHWAKDCKFSDPVKWLAMGLQPSAAYFYSFRKRLGPAVAAWHQQVIDRAVAAGGTTGAEASLDGTFLAALGSRHRLLQAKTLAHRLEVLQQALAADGRAARVPAAATGRSADRFAAPSKRTAAAATDASAACPDGTAGAGADLQVATPNVLAAPATAATAAPPTRTAAAAGVPGRAARPPYWMATTSRGRGRQLHRFRQAQERLEALLAHHAQHETRKAKRKRRRPEQVRICPSEPEAALGRDKLKTFRPLYNVQLACALDTPLILSYGVHATTTDAGLFIPTMQALTQTLGHPPQRVLVDGIYATAANLAYGEDEGITLFAPVDDKPAAAAGDGPGAAAKKAKQLGKEQFRWHAGEQTYYCPQGHRLIQIGCKAEKREQDQQVLVYQYRCPAGHCQVCPRAAECTSAPHKGRTIKRSEHEDKVEALRQRMHTPEGEALYKKRAQTVEPRFGDLKAHRGLSRFAGFGIALALIQVGLLVLVHNGLCLLRARPQPTPSAERQNPSLDDLCQPPATAPPAAPGTEAPESHASLPRAPT